MSPFNLAGAQGTSPNGLNDAGVAIGLTTEAMRVGHAFSRAIDGTLTALPDDSNLATTFAVAINIYNKGLVAGIESEDNFASLAPGQGYTKFDVPGAAYTIPRAITDAGIVYGWIQTASNDLHGFRYDPTAAPVDQYRLIDVPGEPYTMIYGASLDGAFLTGTVFDPIGTHSHTFVLGGATTTILDYPNATDTQGGGINASGEIVGTYNGFTGGFFGAVAVPEPSMLATACLGVLVMLGYRRARRA